MHIHVKTRHTFVPPSGIEEVTIDAAKFSANITSYTGILAMSDFSNTFWDNVDVGLTNLRFTDDADSPIDYFIFDMDIPSKTGWLYYTTAIDSTVDTVLQLQYNPDTPVAPSATDTFAEHTAYTACDRYNVIHEFTTGNTFVGDRGVRVSPLFIPNTGARMVTGSYTTGGARATMACVNTQTQDFMIGTATNASVVAYHAYTGRWDGTRFFKGAGHHANSSRMYMSCSAATIRTQSLQSKYDEDRSYYMLFRGSTGIKYLFNGLSNIQDSATVTVPGETGTWSIGTDGTQGLNGWLFHQYMTRYEMSSAHRTALYNNIRHGGTAWYTVTSS